MTRERASVGEEVEGLVLAGGHARRFGSDKALAAVNGRAMITRVYDRVAAVASTVRISVDSEKRIYDDEWAYVVDGFSDSGPLAGIHAGLVRCKTPWLLVVATDYPFITGYDLKEILAARSAHNVIVVSRDPQGVEQPLCACYRTTLVERLEGALRGRRLQVGAFVESVRNWTTVVDLSAESARNINTREDL